MKKIILKYLWLTYGFLFILIMTPLLQYVGYIKIDPNQTIVNIILVLVWGTFCSFLIKALLYHKKEPLFYLILTIWLLSLFGFVLAKYLSSTILATTALFAFAATNCFLLWSWYMQSYMGRRAKAFFRARRIFIRKLVLAVLLFVTMITVDDYMKVPDNPITFVLLTLFWLTVVNMLAPKFFKKYRLLIFGIYGSLLIFFTVFISYFEERTHSESLDLFLTFLFPIPLFIILWLYEQWKWFKNLKAEKTKAELSLLKQQVNPHFFFNTLNNLYGLAKQKSDKTPDLILKLSEVMRYVIYKGKESLVPLEDEIEYLENYIEIQEIRQHKKPDIDFKKSIDQHNYHIPPLLFIILLENAFKHGVDTLVDKAYVHIELIVKENKAIFTITNNYDPAGFTTQKGIGLLNLKKRLDIIYGSNYLLQIDHENAIFTARLELEVD
ncbi:sensor histidine kinase [Aquimarina brevivitae]|uniref:Histidine kinase n=1 Tax=Aquimarina brevivitae TaxID=323412 RepID=A0A4Q7PFW9_9FLAO|nr:histidine kinase [Aquimarina brevivitae]RZS99371.1 histidine kinase [Aquimarina brevivitae]